MAITDEDIMVLLQDKIEDVDSKDIRALLEEAIGSPGPHHLVSDSAQADPRVHVVLTTNDGGTFLPKRGFITEHSGLIRDLLADADGETEEVPLPNVATRELTRMLWLLRQGFDAKKLERCIAGFDIDSVVALQEAANFMDVRRITVACAGVIAKRVQEVADDIGRAAQLLELVTPPRLPQELCELWLGRFPDKDEILQLLMKHADQLLAPLVHWDSAWADKGRLSEYCFKLWNIAESTLLKKRSEVIEKNQLAPSLKVTLDADTDNDDLRSVKELKKLMELDLSYCDQITDTGLVHVKELPQLTLLDLRGCKQITDTGLAHLKELVKLTSLDLRGCEQITDTGLAHVKQLTQLTELYLSGSKQITDTGLAHVKELTQLTSLNLWCCNLITDTGLKHVKELTQLTELDLRGSNLITDTGLKHVKELTQLTELDLRGCNQITNAGLPHVKELAQLTELNLSGCKQITDAGLIQISKLEKLTSLKLSGCDQITDTGLAHVKELLQLMELNVSVCDQITDTGLAHVKELTQLTELNLYGCDQITDTGLACFKELKHLTKLSVGPNLTNEGKLFARILTADLDASTLAHTDATWKLPDGTTLLHVAAQKNRKNAVTALLVVGADVYAVDNRGRTPLQIAMEANATDAVCLLQEKGV